MSIHPILIAVTDRIRERSQQSREDYLTKIETARSQVLHRGVLSCSNLAHGYAACSPSEKQKLAGKTKPNIAIVSSYNDMLSAHQPLQCFPEIIKTAVQEAGGIAQFAGGVPAMCDGVTQGQPGMELSLFSRDVIAMSTAIALSHNMFDGVLCLGVCDKIVPGLLIGALSFGHLPTIFIPAGPMPSGLPNAEKTKIRQLFAEGKASREELLKAESDSYHSTGTCTFYGTANSNQLLMEIMGLHLPGTSFINPETTLREAMTQEASRRILDITDLDKAYMPLGKIVDVKTIVNAIIGLLATGGSTNHTIHLVAIAKAAGIIINWDDFAELSSIIPLIARIYPNGQADVNQFHAAGGIAYVIKELLDVGLLHEDVNTITGDGLTAYTKEPHLENDKITWKKGSEKSLDETILRTATDPFSKEGGLKVLQGNLGRAIIKISAVKPEHYLIQAPAIVFNSQEEFIDAYKKGELENDFIAVIKNQGPKANGMPELHKLTPMLGVLQDRGYKVAIVTDGRMSGASGKVPAAIQVTPECAEGGSLNRIINGDIIQLDANKGTLNVKIDSQEFEKRQIEPIDYSTHHTGMGRELFSGFRMRVTSAEEGASSF